MNPTQQSRRNFLKVLGGTGAALAIGSTLPNQLTAAVTSTSEAKLPRLETVRTAFIGVGGRGSGHLKQMLTLEGVEITAICDNYEPAVKKAIDTVKKAGRKEPPGFSKGDEDYKRMLQRDDIDMVIIATPWEWHARMAVDAMKAGKIAFTEVPAGVTLDECWQLVETSEQTGRHCMMMENACYGREELFCLNLCRQGVLGELLHGEAAYLHDLRMQMNEVERGTGSWRTWHYVRRNGNLYPTHGLGPIAQYMGINRGDRFDYLTSVSSNALGRAAYAQKHFPPDHKWNHVGTWNCGDICTSTIKTVGGRTILVQWDETTPRPYSRLNLIQGTRGTFAGYPSRLVIEGQTPSTHEWVEGKDLDPYFKKYEHPLWKKMSEMAKKHGGHGGMDWLMAWRMVYCLRNGEPLDQDVYDAADWSVVGPLSAKSVAARSQSVDMPDFTRGRWKTRKPLAIVGG